MEYESGPEWEIPSDLEDLIRDDAEENGGSGMWSDDRWDPILLTVMAGTSYEGRDIPLAWQIQFDPSDERFQAANARLEDFGLEPDGYGWAEYIKSIFAENHRERLHELHFSDTESDACIVWVESESTCAEIVETVWSLIECS